MVNTWNPQSTSFRQLAGSMRDPSPPRSPPADDVLAGPAAGTAVQPAYQPWRGMSNQGYAAGVNAQSAKDQTALGSAAQLGIAGQNAMGQYGMGQQQALVNSQIAQANALGQMGNMYYNTMGQLGQFGAGLGAAGAMAGADVNKAGALSGALGGMFGGGGGGFNVSGPGGMVGSGRFGFGGGGGGGVAGGRAGGGPDPYAPIGQGFGFLNGLRNDIRSNDSDANRIRKDIGAGFDTTQRNLMDPSIRNAMMTQMQMGYGALDGLYDKSDWGFNTGSPGVSQRIDRGGIGFRNYRL